MDVPPSPDPDRPEPPAWIDEISVAPGPPFLSMGVRSSGGGRWLTPSGGAVRSARSRIVAEHGDEVVVVDPSVPVGPAVAELARTVADDRSPDHDDAAAVAAGTPVEVLGRLASVVADDLCVLARRGDRWVLAAGCVCFPSHWRLADKVGRPIAEVHARVPHYADELAARVDRFIDRLAPDRPAWRRNWLVHVDDRLFAPEPAGPPDPPVTAGNAGDRLWLRSERQTLRRLPASGAVAFSILTQQAPLAVVAGRPALAARMADAVAAWPDDLVEYRGARVLWDPILGWLRSVAA